MASSTNALADVGYTPARPPGECRLLVREMNPSSAPGRKATCSAIIPATVIRWLPSGRARHDQLRGSALIARRSWLGSTRLMNGPG